MADTHQMHETFVLVISQALGGSRSSAPQADPSTAPRSADELEAALMRSLG